VLAPVSRKPLPIPTTIDVAISIQRCLHQGMAPTLIPMLAMEMKKTEYGLNLSIINPPVKKKKKK